MSFASDIQATTLTDTGTAIGRRVRLAGINVVGTATAGTLTFRDGGSGGAIKLTYYTPAAAGGNDLLIPDNGILFETDMHVTFSNNTHVTSVVILYVG
jgi:predicted secreted protein